MKTGGHREGEHHTHWSLSGVGVWGRDSGAWGDWGRIALEEIPNVDDGLMGAANHHVTCIPM